MKLQQVAWLFFIQYFSEREEQETLETVFARIDQDGDGKITIEEIRKGNINADRAHVTLIRLSRGYRHCAHTRRNCRAHTRIWRRSK